MSIITDDYRQELTVSDIRQELVGPLRQVLNTGRGGLGSWRVGVETLGTPATNRTQIYRQELTVGDMRQALVAGTVVLGQQEEGGFGGEFGQQLGQTVQ